MPRSSDIEVDIPGVGLVYFPPEMGMDAIQAKAKELSTLGLQHQHNINRGEEAEAQFGPLRAKAGMLAEIPRVLGIMGGPVGAAYGEAKAQQIEQAGGAREELNPVSIGAQAAIPEAVRLVGKAARPVAKGLYGSALKMSTTIKPEKRLRILETGLSEGRIPTVGSIKNSVARQRLIEKEIDDVIASQPTATVNAKAIASRVDEVAPRFESVTPNADKNILASAKEEFLENYGLKPGPKQTVLDEFGQAVQVEGPKLPKAIPAGKAQDLKKKTYKILGEKAYGEQKTASKEADKALARGLKEELEKIFPELKTLNAKDGALFDLNRALVLAANRIGNRDVLGIGVPIKTEAFGPAGFLAGLLDTPRVHSILAIAIDKARVLQDANRKITSAITRTTTLPSTTSQLAEVGE